MDNKGLSTMQGFIKECYSLLTDTDQKQLWRTHSGTMDHCPWKAFRTHLICRQTRIFIVSISEIQFFSSVYSMHRWAVIILIVFPFVAALPAVCSLQDAWSTIQLRFLAKPWWPMRHLEQRKTSPVCPRDSTSASGPKEGSRQQPDNMEPFRPSPPIPPTANRWLFWKVVCMSLLCW